MAASSAEKTESMYYKVLGRVWAEEDKHPGTHVAGITRPMKGLPVSVKERRPIITVEALDVDAKKEPADVSALRLPNGALRLILSSPSADKPYGTPLAAVSDFGEPLDRSQPPRNQAIGVDIAPGEEPKLMAEDADGTWDALPHVRTTDTVRMAGAIASALSREDREVYVIEGLSDEQLSIHSEN